MIERQNKSIEKTVETKQNVTSSTEKEELVKKILELHYGFSFDSEGSDRYQNYKEIDTLPEKKGKSK